MPTIAAVVEFLNALAPSRLAADWDNVGLLLGDAAAPAASIMTCLTVTTESAAEAIEAGAKLIVSHHPILFRPSKRLTTATIEGSILWSLAGAGVAVYSPHTAFDNAPGGINDLLADKLELRDVEPLKKLDSTGTCKIVVFVPEADLNRVAGAMFAAGAGVIGQYSQCSYRLAGTGTFFGSDASNPAVGLKGRREEVSEWRLEVVCPDGLIEKVVAAMRSAHSYEEPAFDVYPLRAQRSPVGVGRLGKLPTPMSLEAFGRVVKVKLGVASIQLVGDPKRKVERIAVICGSGGELLGDAAAKKADVFLTGEARFHDCLAAIAYGLALALPGHYATERPGVEDLAARLQRQFPSAQVWASRREADPLTFLA
ncbi:MAG: Nif3-like dinuclear metal center hexameric protein [Planctomycetes bacterium]|nr:Nif3-like dinuclear metal center hexameric protein [Planctomycetota bacterium]